MTARVSIAARAREAAKQANKVARARMIAKARVAASLLNRAAEPESFGYPSMIRLPCGGRAG
jgi:hypothetical protein